MNKKTFFILVAAVILLVIVVWAGKFLETEKTEKRVYKIGVLVRGKSYEAGVTGFLAKMRELGYKEGENVGYEIRFADKREDLPAIIKEFLDNNVDLIHTYSTPATIEAYKQTKSVPVVFGSMGDPVASGVIKSLQHPGTNVTGIGSLSVDLAAKRLEFLNELFPQAKKAAIPFTPADIPGRRSFEVASEAASKLGIELVQYHISAEKSPKDIAKEILRRDVDGIIISADSAVWANLSFYVEQSIKEKLPFVVFDKDMVEKGGLVGYGPDYFAVGTQAAVLAHKILGGAKPGDLPIEVPSKLVLAVNLKTAKEIGFTVPDKFLAKTDLIIK